MATESLLINGVDVREVRSFRDAAQAEPSRADRDPVVTAEWQGGDRSVVRSGDAVIEVNAPGTLGPMKLLLASLLACEIDVVAMHAALIGVKLERLSIEASGHFNVRSYLGLSGTPGSGYERIDYTARLRAPGVSEEQIAVLREALERSSPVGDSLSRMVTMRANIEVEPA
jgi:uncharacterized OsmC-like protein